MRFLIALLTLTPLFCFCADITIGNPEVPECVPLGIG